MPRDDDLDYTVVALLVLERTNGEITVDDVASEWLARLPIGQLFTAERAAYRNLVLGIRPPATASHRNPYREWIGALIRADAYAYVHPGDPRSAARAAAIDASVSHVGNGVAAAMWAAAVISLALAGVPPDESVPSATGIVPAGSRLRLVLDRVVALYRAESSVDDCFADIDAATAEYGWIHAIPNAAVIAASLLWGRGDFDRSVSLVVGAGRDTDSNGATVGSAAGGLIGAASLGAAWTDPFEDTLRTSVAGIGATRISDLARRTTRLVGVVPSVS
jgi:ADP-ribosylglycohydrolase